MAETGLGVALKALRVRDELSLRTAAEKSDVDHAYVYRLETGEKVNPSHDHIEKILSAYHITAREATLVTWLVEHPDTDPELVRFVLADQSISVEIFTAAAGIRHRGHARPDPAALIARVKRVFEEEAE